MKKISMFLMLAVSFVASSVSVVFAGFGDFAGGVVKDLFSSYNGWTAIVVIVAFVIIWLIRWTKTKKDDEILDNYVSVGIEYALKVMPKDSKIDWVKFVGNALGKFSEVYTKTNELPADAKLYDKAKQLIEKIAELKQIEQLKN